MESMSQSCNRRSIVRATVALLGVNSGRALRAQSRSGVQDRPVVLHVMDAIGNLSLTQPAFEAFRREKPDLVARVVFHEAPAARIAKLLQRHEDMGQPGFDLLLTGLQLLLESTEEKAWLPTVAPQLAELEADLLPSARAMQDLADGQAMVVSYGALGPLLAFAPDRVKHPPGTAEELLAWARSNVNRFSYGRPPKSEAAQAFLLGLPYLLGDTDPLDPVSGWTATWSFLGELGATIESYSAGDRITLMELSAGARDIVATTPGAALQMQVAHRGAVPMIVLAGAHWIGSAHYAAVPRDVPASKAAVLVELIKFLVSKQGQAFAYDQVRLLPGMAVADVSPPATPWLSHAGIVEPGERAAFDRLIASRPIAAPLAPRKLAYALQRWDSQIGAAKS